MGQRLLILFLALFVASAYGGLGGEGLGLYRISLDKESQQHLRVPVREKLRGQIFNFNLFHKKHIILGN